jgi:hypothetical protein
MKQDSSINKVLAMNDNPYRFLVGGECPDYLTFNPENTYGFSLGIKWLNST